MGVKLKEKVPGEWWIFIDHHGKRKAKKIGRDKRLALEVAKKIEAKLVLGDLHFDEKKVPNFKEYAERWIETVARATCKRSTLENYRGKLKKDILPVFGKLSVSEVNRMKVKEFLIEKVNKGFSSSAVGNFKTIISGTLELAVDDKSLNFNPTYRLGKGIKSTSQKLTVEPLTQEELFLLLETFRVHFPKYYPLVLTLARTGMRIGEVLGLQWGDIDFHGQFIKVQRSFSRGKLDTPKSGKSRRVDMSNQLAETLKGLLKQAKADKLSNGWNELPEWIFLNSEKNPVCDSCFRDRIFPKALAKAGLRKIRIHDLRHTYASLLIQNCESLAYIKDQLGHFSIKMTVDIYGHLAPSGNHDAVNRLDDDVTTRNLYATRKQLKAKTY